MDVAYPRGDCVIEAYQEEALFGGGGRKTSPIPPGFNPFGGKEVLM